MVQSQDNPKSPKTPHAPREDEISPKTPHAQPEDEKSPKTLHAPPEVEKSPKTPHAQTTTSLPPPKSTRVVKAKFRRILKVFMIRVKATGY